MEHDKATHVLFAGLHEPCAADVSAAVAPTAVYTVQDTVEFKTLTEAILAALAAGEKEEMVAKLTDLETAWDAREDILKPKDAVTWALLDKTLDKAISSLHRSKIDLPKGKTALEDLLKNGQATKQPAHVWRCLVGWHRILIGRVKPLEQFHGYWRVRYLGLPKNQLELTLKAVAYNLKRRREIVYQAITEATPLAGEIEVDESYSGGRRKGKRGCGVAGKVPLFGLLKRTIRWSSPTPRPRP